MRNPVPPAWWAERDGASETQVELRHAQRRGRPGHRVCRACRAPRNRINTEQAGNPGCSIEPIGTTMPREVLR
jgi:hypothetical protein